MRTCFTTGSTPRSLLWALLLIGVLFGCGTTQSDPPYRVATEADQQGPFTNRLVEASSPYLLQHAHNPVDWQEWGDAAFEEARRRDVPVLLSVGYAACHWCHVMEHESFANPAIAAFLNAHFVAIKVDREERPDVDAVYMAALQRMTGHGGWPMTLFLTPDRKPFYGGTYYPPEDRSNRPGFRTVLDRVHRGWTTDRTGVLQSAEALTQDLEQATARVRAAEGLPDSPEADAVRALLAQWDPVHHGFGTSTRFPDVPAVRLLLHHGIRTDNPEVLDTVLTLLHTMERSGLHDHLAGGFHRYTVDRAWRIPHFEKMLYDNAQLLELYAEASVALDEPRFAYTASWIAAWLVADLRHRSGAYMSSLDADAAGEEGTTYVWTPDQVKAVLGHHSQPFLQAYTVSSPGNFEGASVLYRPDADPRDPALLIARQKLLQARKLREQPALDHKRVVGWNGLAISALARAGRWLDQPSFGVAAERAAKACLDGRRPDGALPRTLEEGSPLGVLDDYAYLARGLLDLYEATGDRQWLVAAQATADQARLRFWEAGRGYHYADRAVPGLLVRQLDWTDGDKPSGAAVMLSVEQRLLALGAPDRTRSRLGADVRSAAGWLTVAPSAVPTLARVTGQHQRGAVQVVLAPAERTPEALEPFWEILDEAIRPGVVVGYAAPADETMTRPFSVLEGKTADGTRTRVYVCKDGVCDAPVDTPEALRLALERTSRRSAAAPASQAVPAPKPALQPGVQRSSRPKP